MTRPSRRKPVALTSPAGEEGLNGSGSRPSTALALTVARGSGIANGWLRYLPHERNFAEPNAEQKYEILQSTLHPAAATRLLERAAALLQELDS